MRGILTRVALAVIWLALIPFSASAAIISFKPLHVSGTQWTYEYYVYATASDPIISELTIFFDQTLYENLVIRSSAPTWASLVIQPDIALSSDGFFDTLALASGLTPGMSQGDFQVSFDFRGVGTPGAQRFEIIDPETFEPLLSGVTSAAVVTPPSTQVPEPRTQYLVLGALAMLIARRGWQVVER